MVRHGEVMAESNSADTPNGPSVPQRLLTLKEVSDMLRVHPNSIRRWSDTGLLPAVRIGERGDRRFRLQDVERFLQGHLPESRSKPARSGKSPRRRTESE
jgi:excisionase family DNA binding protein